MAEGDIICEFRGRETQPCPSGPGGCVLGGRVHADGDHYCNGAPDSAAAIEREVTR